uniref:Uncharacterized protein n=1 Tax=Acrobeloides nanus TaxID=290746 RepID=A0A914CH25_9BILA
MITFTVGFWTCVATIVVFKPFRDALKELVNNPRMFFKKKRPSLFDRIMKNLNLDKIVLMNKNMVLSKERNILFEKSSTVIPISNPNRRGSSTLGLSKPQNDIH